MRSHEDTHEAPGRNGFDHFATGVARATGHAWAFTGSVLLVVAWALAGPVFHFSNTWQLVINTGTTVLTFLMVFVIQNSLNRDSQALHLKLDELIRVSKAAQDELIGADELPEKKILAMRAQEEAEAAPPADGLARSG